MDNQTQNTPGWGLKDFKSFWKDDLKAGLSVSLVALPLGLGIALASGAPAMSGIIPSVIGGLITTFIRGSHVAINGPTAGQIVVVLAGMELLRDDNGVAFPYVLAAIVMAGCVQMVFGLLKQGKLGELFPSAVIQGMLAAIGLIIFAKQIHVALGVDVETNTAMDALLEIPMSLIHLNPYVVVISIVSILILIFHPKLNYQIPQLFPAPLWVLIFSIPMVYMFGFFEHHNYNFLGFSYYGGPDFLIDIPKDITTSIIFPNFSRIGDWVFWITVAMITLVASIETLISTKAVDRLDEYKRKTNLNRDLFGVGLSTAASGMIGGLPIITVILRSSININHNAKTRWSNFFHGMFIFILVLLFPSIIRQIPEACLATILVYSGYKLASVKVFRNTLLKGWEQLVILIITLICVLTYDILWGVIIGVVSTLLLHWMRSELQFSTFFRHLLIPSVKTRSERENIMHVEAKGICNFLITLRLLKKLQEIPKHMNVVLDFSKCKVVDSTILEHIYEHKDKYYNEGLRFDIIGLDIHKSSSPHPYALHVLEKPMHRRLTSRQNDLLHYARGRGFHYRSDISWDTAYLKRFRFFEHKIIEYTQNVVKGKYEDVGIPWELCDVSYNEGVLLAAEEHHITVQMLKFGTRIPNFYMAKENITQLKGMWRDYIKSNDENTSIGLFTTDLIHFLLAHDSYSIEALGSRMLIYKKERLASFQEIMKMLDFSKQLVRLLPLVEENHHSTDL